MAVSGAFGCMCEEYRQVEYIREVLPPQDNGFGCWDLP